MRARQRLRAEPRRVHHRVDDERARLRCRRSAPPSRRWRALSRSTGVSNAIMPPRSSRSPCSASMKPWLSMMPVSGECSAATQYERGLHRARRVAADQLKPFDAVDRRPAWRCLSILARSASLGRDDQLAAAPVRHAVRGAEFVEHAPAAHAVPRAQRAGRVVHAGMDHLAVARGHAVADAVGRLRDDHLMAGERGLPARPQGRPRRRR